MHARNGAGSSWCSRARRSGRESERVRESAKARLREGESARRRESATARGRESSRGKDKRAIEEMRGAGGPPRVLASALQTVNAPLCISLQLGLVYN